MIRVTRKTYDAVRAKVKTFPVNDVWSFDGLTVKRSGIVVLTRRDQYTGCIFVTEYLMCESLKYL